MHYHSKQATRTGDNRIPRRHVFLIGALLIIAGIIAAMLPHSAVATKTAVLHDIQPAATKSSRLPALSLEDTSLPLIQATRVTHRTHNLTVTAGDSMARIFARLDLSPRQLHQIMQLNQETQTLKDLRPGQKLSISRDVSGQVSKLVYEIDNNNSLHISRRGSVFSASTIEREYATKMSHATGTIRRSLYEDAKSAGLDDNLIMELAGIFGWDIDFALDLRSNDRFSLIFEEQFLDGRKMRNGPIVAAEFVSRGVSYQAVRYTDANGRTDYYSPDGRSMRKEFLRTPVDFKRISSRFGNRKHPVLNKMRMHRGVDYAASRGTPVRATGNGKVIYKGRKGGYGNTLIVRHGGKYSTLYAHLKSYHRGLRKGSAVKQGQTIAYVGSSGLATGPHLHYEFRVHGVHRNPLKVKLPDANPIYAGFKKDFSVKATTLIARLQELNSTTTVAVNP